MSGSRMRLALLSIITAAALACERDTRIVIEGDTDLRIVMSGSGRLGFLQIQGPNKQRESNGEEAFTYWMIQAQAAGSDVVVEKLSPITYGRVPNGYRQIYPERGAVPPLVEGEIYYVRAETNNANGAGKYFNLRQGKIDSADYPYEFNER